MHTVKKNAFFLVFVLFFLQTGLMGMEQEFFVAPSVSFDTNPTYFPEFFEFAAEDESDMGLSLDAGYSMTFLKSGRNSAGFNVDLGMTSYQEEDYLNNESVRLGAYYMRENMGDFSFYVNWAYDSLSVDGKARIYSNTLSPTLFWKQSDTLTGMAKIRIKLWEDYGADWFAGTDLGVEIKEIWQMSKMHELSGSLFVQDKAAADGAFAFFGMRLTVEYTLLLSKELTVHANASFGTESYQDDFPGLGDPREDTFLIGGASVNYNFGEKMGTAFVGVLYMSNTSNVDGGATPDFEVDVTVISVGYKYGFTF